MQYGSHFLGISEIYLFILNEKNINFYDISLVDRIIDLLIGCCDAFLFYAGRELTIIEDF